jgi:hypothetical protein
MIARLRSALVLLGIVAAAGGAQTIPIKAGITVAPDSVRIGDPFRVTIGIRAPRGATIEFPRATDSTSTVQSLDPVVVRTAGDTTAVEQYADYRVAAWDVGVQRIRLADAIVRYNGADRRVPLSGDSIFVRSLLPADTAKRVPKPPRALFELSVVPWWLWALLAAAVVAIGLLVWWWIRRRRRPAAPIIVDPFQYAESEFQRIEALGLLEAGERGRYVTLMVEVLRDYLAARYTDAAALSFTSTELQHATRALPHVPQERLIRLLTDADLIKFARRPVSTDRAREIGREARAVVSHEHAASHPPVSVAPKAAA